MVQSASIAGGPPYRGGQALDGRQRAVAVVAVVAIHAGVLGSFLLAELLKSEPPPESTLAVSFISEAAEAPAPPPPQPAVATPPPEPTLVASSRPTESPMTAPPVEETPRPAVQAAPQPPQPPAPPSAVTNAATAPSIVPPNFNAAYLNNPGAAYPYASRRKREQGTVRLRVQVSADGAPTQVVLDRTSGFADLDKAALDVVRNRWRFAPAKQGDRAVSAWVIVPMEFSLKN